MQSVFSRIPPLVASRSTAESGGLWCEASIGHAGSTFKMEEAK